MTCLKALREAARVEVKPAVRLQLTHTADVLLNAINLFELYTDAESLTILNGAWSRAVKVLKLATPAVPTPTPSGRMPVPQERKAA